MYGVSGLQVKLLKTHKMSLNSHKSLLDRVSTCAHNTCRVPNSNANQSDPRAKSVTDDHASMFLTTTAGELNCDRTLEGSQLYKSFVPFAPDYSQLSKSRVKSKPSGHDVT